MINIIREIVNNENTKNKINEICRNIDKDPIIVWYILVYSRFKENKLISSNETVLECLDRLLMSIPYLQLEEHSNNLKKMPELKLMLISDFTDDGEIKNKNKNKISYEKRNNVYLDELNNYEEHIKNLSSIISKIEEEIKKIIKNYYEQVVSYHDKQRKFIQIIEFSSLIKTVKNEKEKSILEAIEDYFLSANSRICVTLSQLTDEIENHYSIKEYYPFNTQDNKEIYFCTKKFSKLVYETTELKLLDININNKYFIEELYDYLVTKFNDNNYSFEDFKKIFNKYQREITALKQKLYNTNDSLKSTLASIWHFQNEQKKK